MNDSRLEQTLTICRLTRAGNISYDMLEAAVRQETKAIICTHGSNLYGNLNDIERIGKIAKAHKLLFIVDASQTAGGFQ